jgi:TIR domain
MRAIFLSYRREDAEGEAGRLFADLVKYFGDDKVFMDVAAIDPGRDFRKVIDENVASCGVLLALIGPHWVDAQDAGGKRRLDNPVDFVRLETASALKRDIPVIPVLVHEAKMPLAEQLPQDLKDLCFRNGVELTHARWDSDVQVLIKGLGKCFGERVEARDAARQAPAAGAGNRPMTADQETPRLVHPPDPPVISPPPRQASSSFASPPEPAVSKGLKIGICIATLFVPILGLIMGVIYMNDANPEKKAVGKLWLIVGVGAAIFVCLIFGNRL